MLRSYKHICLAPDAPMKSDCQLSTVNCQLSTVNCQLSTVNCQLTND
ncbi:hypothetical protein [Microcoleus sp. CAWBG58]|nr:hypothetical protein [Microcoleus sp. CAWBG58]